MKEGGDSTMKNDSEYHVTTAAMTLVVVSVKKEVMWRLIPGKCNINAGYTVIEGRNMKENTSITYHLSEAWYL